MQEFDTTINIIMKKNSLSVIIHDPVEVCGGVCISRDAAPPHVLY